MTTTNSTKKRRGRINIEPTDPDVCGPCEMLIKIGDETIAHIAPYLSFGNASRDGWYWYAWSDTYKIKPINTLTNNKGIPPVFDGYEAAEKSCLKYIKERLRLKGDRPNKTQPPLV